MAARKAIKKRVTRKPAKAANRTIIKAKRVVIRAINPPKTKTLRVGNRSHILDILGQAKATTKDGVKGWTMARRFYATGKGTQKLTGGQKFLDLATGYVYAKRAANPTKKKTGPKRRRNAESFSPDHPIEVRRYYRGGGPGYETKRQRVIRQGQRDLFAPEASTDELLKYLRAGNPTVISVVKKRLGAKAFASASPSLLRKTMIAILKEKKAKAAQATKAKAKPRKRNPETKAQAGFESFNGRPSTKEQKLNFPDGTPSGLYVLGQFVAFQLVGGAIVKPSTATGKTYLCADTRGKLHLGTTGERLTDAPRGEVGTIKLVEYLQRKPHLGFPEKTIFFHKAGEETGEKPTLYSDGKGGLLIRGGAYSITPEGIKN